MPVCVELILRRELADRPSITQRIDGDLSYHLNVVYVLVRISMFVEMVADCVLFSVPLQEL